MTGTLTVVLIADLRAECAVEVKYYRPRRSSPDCKGKAFLIDYKWYCLVEMHSQERVRIVHLIRIYMPV